MKNKTLGVAVIICLIATLFFSNAFARDGGNRHKEDRRGGQGRDWNHSYYRDYGRSHDLDFFGLQFAFGSKIGNIAVRLPMGYQTVIVRGEPYYRYDGAYYKKCQSGYIIVPESDLYYDAKPAPIINKKHTGETVTINVPNSNGSYTPIALVKYNNGYIGPQGEYYPGNPNVEQLRALYGR
jgi:hypothetical protein